MSITGEAAGRPPVKFGPPVTDITAGILGAMGVSAAYAHKLQTGLGQRVDTSLYEAGITHTFWQSAIAFATGSNPQPLGSAHPLNAPYQAIPTKDGWVNIGAANQSNWLAMLTAIGAEHLRDDERFSKNSDRMKNLPALIAELEQIFAARTTDHWINVLNNAGIPAGPINSISDMHEDAQTLARDMVIEVDHPVAGKLQTLGAPVKFHGTPGGVQCAAPTLGQHTKEVLLEIGYKTSDINEFINAGVVGH